jgi:hypothetical protein
MIGRLRDTLRDDLWRLELALRSDDFDLDRIKPLLNAALADHLDDALIWDRVYDAINESTPPPRPIASSVQQTPWLRHTGSFVNSSEHRRYVDNVLRDELGPMYVDLQDFHKTYFGNVPNLETASKTFFEDCSEGSNPLFGDGWRGWPEEAKLASFATGWYLGRQARSRTPNPWVRSRNIWGLTYYRKKTNQVRWENGYRPGTI